MRDGHRLIGMIQPDASHSTDETRPALFRVGCVGRITQLAEAGDGRYILELTGIARFKVVEEMTVLTAYRQCKVDYFPFIDDFTARKGEEAVDREALLAVLTDFLKANNLKVDWEGVESAPNEALVNALAMMSPYGPAEKQAMLEAPDLKTRAEILIAVTEMDLAKKRTSGDPPGCSSQSSDRGGPGYFCSEPDTVTNPSRRPEHDILTRAPRRHRRPKLLEILVCPLTKGPLEFDAARQELISRSAKLAYPIRDGIPIMLPEEARKIE